MLCPVLRVLASLTRNRIINRILEYRDIFNKVFMCYCTKHTICSGAITYVSFSIYYYHSNITEPVNHDNTMNFNEVVQLRGTSSGFRSIRSNTNLIVHRSTSTLRFRDFYSCLFFPQFGNTNFALSEVSINTLGINVNILRQGLK